MRLRTTENHRDFASNGERIADGATLRAGVNRGRSPTFATCPTSLLLAGRGLSFPIPDCLRCGVCCHSTLDTYVRVTGADWDRLGVDAERLAHFIGNRAYMKMSTGHCAALELRPATDGATEFFCTVYDRRPQTCRDLGRGTSQCEAELVRKAPLAAPLIRPEADRRADV